MSGPEDLQATLTAVCRLDELHVERGATALVHGQAVAVFRTRDDRVHVLGNYDPISKAGVLARGIVGTRDGVAFVGSTTHGRAFSLHTGRCLDDETVAVPVYSACVVDGVVMVGPRRQA